VGCGNNAAVARPPRETVDWVTVADAAGLLNVDRRKVYRLIRSGHLPAERIGRAFRIKRSDVDVLAATANQLRRLDAKRR
jgi:excisionase family DNA binding protein